MPRSWCTELSRNRQLLLTGFYSLLGFTSTIKVGREAESGQWLEDAGERAVPGEEHRERRRFGAPVFPLSVTAWAHWE